MKAWNSYEHDDRIKLREKFWSRSGKPVGLLTLDDFLTDQVAADVLLELQSAEFTTWIGYVGSDGKPTAHFSDELPDLPYITIHRRSKKPLPAINQLCSALGSKAFLEHLSALTGVEVQRLLPLDSSICHLMGPGDFLREHTDFGPPEQRTKLVISLSLAKGWTEGFGGVTYFLWGSGLKVCPQFNCATVFAPHEGSMHGVSQINPDAPLSRFTMTFHYV